METRYTDDQIFIPIISDITMNGSFLQVSAYYQNQLESRGWRLTKSKIRNENVRLEFRRGNADIVFRLERVGNAVRLTIELDD